MNAIEAEHLFRTFGTVTAVNDISFNVRPGEFFGLLGPDGAGKTTTINLLCALVRPTGGTARVNGYDILLEPDRVRHSVGLINHEPTLNDRLSAFGSLAYYAKLYNVPRHELHQLGEQLLNLLNLWDLRDVAVRSLTEGMRRRLDVVRALLRRPSVLFLDEPLLGIDPETTERIWWYLSQLRRREGITLFLATSQIAQVVDCDRVAHIDVGRIVAVNTPDGLGLSPWPSELARTFPEPPGRAWFGRIEPPAGVGLDPAAQSQRRPSMLLAAP